MADRSSIEWTDATWNIVTGCSRVSRGCENCWAEREAARRLRHHSSRQGLTDRNGRWTGQARFNWEWLDKPLRWQKPRRIFVAASGDLFHETVHDSWLDRIWAVMALCRHHRFQILTKRPERMRRYLDGPHRQARIFDAIRQWMQYPVLDVANPITPSARRWLRENKMLLRADVLLRPALPNVWIGTSVEDQPAADERIPVLLDIPAAVRWISAEPLLGQVEIDALLAGEGHPAGLDWVVAGGESGPGARPMDPSWPRTLRNQCICARVPFFFKQWGGITSKAGGCELDGRQWRQMPGELG